MRDHTIASCLLVLLFAPWATAWADDSDHLLMVFIKPKDGREREFFESYQGEHLAEVMARQGFVSGQVNVAPTGAAGLSAPSPVLVTYGIHSDNLAETFALDSQVAQKARIPDPAHEPGFTRSFAFTATGAETAGSDVDFSGKGELASYSLFCLNDAPGNPCHEKQLLATPGFIAAQRYERSAAQRYSGADSPRRLVRFTLVTDDLHAVFDHLDAQGLAFASGGTLQKKGPMAFVYRALGHRVDEDAHLAPDRQAALQASVENLLTRVEELEDKDAIWQLLSKYSLNVDMGRAEDFLALFTDDCVFASDIGGTLRYRRGKDELAEMLAGGAPPLGQHLQLDYHIEIDGDSATAIGYQVLTNLRDNGLRVARPAFRSIKLRKEEGSWKIREIYTIGIDNAAARDEILPDHL